MVAQVQFNIDSHFNEDARFRKVLFGYDGQLLEVELNEMQDILNARLAEVVDNVFGTRPLYAGTYSVSGGVLTISNEVVIAGREVILLTSSSITVANGDTIYLNINNATKTNADQIKQYGDQNSNTTVTNYIQDSRAGQETTRRIQVTYMLSKTNTNPGTNIQLCTINSSGAVVLGSPDSFSDSNLYKEIRRLANEQQTANNLQPLKNVYGVISAGGATMTASTTTDTFTIAAGTAVSLTGNASTKTLTIAVPNATTSADGSMSSADKTKLNGIASGAQVNQNAFANISAGGTTLASTTTSDTFTVSGSGAVTVAGSGKTVTVGINAASTSAVGAVQLTDSYTSTSVTTAATANSAKMAYDNAVSWAKGYGLGTYSVTKSSVDLSTLTTNGFYYALNCTNKPSTAGNGYVLVQAYSSTYISQIYMDVTNGNMYVRANNNGTWGSWIQMATTAAVTTSVNGLMISTDKSKLDAINQSLGTTNSPSFNALTLSVGAGTAPMTVTSTTKVTNMNADMVDGYHFNQSLQTTDTPTFAGLTLSGPSNYSGSITTKPTGTATSTNNYGSNVLQFQNSTWNGTAAVATNRNVYMDSSNVLQFQSSGGSNVASVDDSGNVTGNTLKSTVASGTAPMTVTSTTMVTNLNADMVDGYNFNQSLQTTDSPSFSKVTSTVATGTAPFTVTSTTKVTNLNADMVDGYSFNQSLQTTDSPSFSKVTSTVATGTAPFVVSSTTNVANLSADMVDGYHMNQGLQTTNSPSFNALTLSVATGTAPMTVTSTTKVTNLNADMVDGYSLNQGVQTTDSPSFSKVTSTVATGTAPFTVTSTTKVTNLNADMVDGYNFNQDVQTTASPSFAGLTVSGTASLATVTATTQTASDNSTKVATTAYVKSQGYLTANQSITVSGDASGSGATSISLTLASVGTAGTYTKVTTDAKGRVTSGTTLSTSDLPNYGTANGVASLDSSGNVPKAQLGNLPPTNLLTNPNFWIQ